MKLVPTLPFLLHRVHILSAVPSLSNRLSMLCLLCCLWFVAVGLGEIMISRQVGSTLLPHQRQRAGFGQYVDLL